MPTESEEFSSLVDETSLFLTRLNSYDDEEKRILKAAVDFMAKFLTGKEKDRVILESIIESTLLKQSFCSVIEYALIYTERKGFVNVIMHVFLNNGQKEAEHVIECVCRNAIVPFSHEEITKSKQAIFTFLFQSAYLNHSDLFKIIIDAIEKISLEELNGFKTYPLYEPESGNFAENISQFMEQKTLTKKVFQEAFVNMVGTENPGKACRQFLLTVSAKLGSWEYLESYLCKPIEEIPVEVFWTSIILYDLLAKNIHSSASSKRPRLYQITANLLQKVINYDKANEIYNGYFFLRQRKFG